MTKEVRIGKEGEMSGGRRDRRNGSLCSARRKQRNHGAAVFVARWREGGEAAAFRGEPSGLNTEHEALTNYNWSYYKVIITASCHVRPHLGLFAPKCAFLNVRLCKLEVF